MPGQDYMYCIPSQILNPRCHKIGRSLTVRREQFRGTRYPGSFEWQRLEQ